MNLYEAALADYQNQKVNSAVEKLLAFLDDDPENEDALESLAVILYNEKRYDEAIEVLNYWIEFNPDSIMARTNLSRAYLGMNMILEAEKQQAEARRLTWKAELKAKKLEMPKVDHKAQIEKFKQVIAFDPADVLGYFSLGQAYLEAGQKRDALDAFQKAVEVDPGHSASYLGLGTVLEELGDKKRAKAVFEKGIPVADSKGDMMTQKKMEAHLRGLK